MADKHPFTLDRKDMLRELTQVRAILERAPEYTMTDQVEANRSALLKLTDVVEALMLVVEIPKEAHDAIR